MYENLMEEVVRDENRARALEAVKRNQGAPGIDQMQTTELESHLQAHWEKIRAKLLAGAWVPSPVRRVEMAAEQSQLRCDTEAERGHAQAGHSDGDGPADSADAVTSADADLRSAVQRAQLRISTGAQRTGSRASRAAIRAGKGKTGWWI
jgi:hypothetical protein